MIDTSASKRFAEAPVDRPSCSNGAVSPFGHVDDDRGLAPPAQRGGYRAWTWLNLVCLDAPLVAVSWHWLFSREFGGGASDGRASGALFLTAWVIYLADRFGDSLSVIATGAASQRQRFCIQHRSVWVSGTIALAIADVVVCATLDHRTLFTGAAVGALALAYLAINQTRAVVWRRLPLKEVTIGFLFAAGTITPLHSSLTIEALPAWLLFGALCSLDCISIAVWERGLDAAQQRISIATAFPKTGRYSSGVLLLLVAAGLALIAPQPQLWRVYLCVATSALLLWFVNRAGDRLDPDIRTALADLVLLTPIPLLLTESFV